VVILFNNKSLWMVGNLVWSFPPSRLSFTRGALNFEARRRSSLTEMTVALQSPQDGGRVQCSGVVIACSGNKHTGYHISLVFTGMSRQAELRLNLMAHSSLGAS